MDDKPNKPIRRKRNPPRVKFGIESESFYDIPIPLKSSKKNIFADLAFGITHRRADKELWEQPDSVYKMEKRVAKEVWEEMKEGLSEFETEAAQYIYDFEVDFSKLKWIKNDGLIVANLNKKRNCKFLEMMKILTRLQIPLNYSKRYGRIEVDGKKKFPILFEPSAENISEVARLINRSESQAIKYIAGAERTKPVGLLSRLGTLHRGSFLILGYQEFYKDKKGEKHLNRIYFLKDTPNVREALRTFRRPD